METCRKILIRIEESCRKNSRLKVADKQPQMSAVGEGHGARSDSKSHFAASFGVLVDLLLKSDQ